MKRALIISLGLILGISAYAVAEEMFDMTVPLKGSSIANPDLQQQALPEVYASVSAKSPACRQFSIANTKVIQEPHDLEVEGDEFVAGYWMEAWTVQYCGYTVDVPVKFTIEKDTTQINVQTNF